MQKSPDALHHALMRIFALCQGRDSNPLSTQICEIARNALQEYSDTRSAGKSVYTHVKRGTNYRVESVVEVQASTSPLYEGDLVVVYRSIINRNGYVRKLVEFNDGRFVRIAERNDHD